MFFGLILHCKVIYPGQKRQSNMKSSFTLVSLDSLISLGWLMGPFSLFLKVRLYWENANMIGSLDTQSMPKLFVITRGSLFLYTWTFPLPSCHSQIHVTMSIFELWELLPTSYGFLVLTWMARLINYIACLKKSSLWQGLINGGALVVVSSFMGKKY